MGDTSLLRQRSATRQLDLANAGMSQSSQSELVHPPGVSEKKQPDTRNGFLMSGRSSFVPLVITALEFPYQGAAAPRACALGR